MMNIVYVKISDLKPSEYNPRKADKKQCEDLDKSIEEFGLVEPMVVNKAKGRENIIIGGHFRVRRAKKKGFKEVPVVYVDIPDIKREKELNLRLNKNTGEWDFDLLANFDEELLENVGFENLGEIFQTEVEEDDVPELAKDEPESKIGEVYQLGRHRLMCGDATKTEDVEKLMDGKKADMVFTDPPYNVKYEGKTSDKLKISNDSFKTKMAFYQFLYESISAMRPFVKGDVYICMSSSELHTLQKAFVDCGGHWSTFIIWVKNHFTFGRSNYQRQYEPILYGWFDGSSHYWSGNRKLGDVVKQEDANIDDDGNVWVRADNVSTDVWEIDRPSVSKQHPTMKPVKLCTRGITNSSKRGDIVLDTFGGSGSTLIACEQTKRTCYMMELDPRYCDVIKKRYNNFIKK